MPEEKLAAEPKPARKPRKKKTLQLDKVFLGNLDYHICRISAREDVSVPGLEQAMLKLSTSMMKWVMQKLHDQGLEPADVHVALSFTVDTNDHPGGETQPMSTLVN